MVSFSTLARKGAHLIVLPCLMLLSGCSMFLDKAPGGVHIVHEASSEGELFVGVGDADITPKKNIYMGGFTILRTSTGVKHPLTARSLLIKRGDVELLLVSLDLVGMLYDDLAEIRGSLEGITPEQVVIACTHNHHSPDTIGVWGLPPLWSGLDDEYMKQIKGAVNEAYLAARKSLQPAEFGYNSITFESKDFIKNSNHRGLIDPEIVVAHFRNPDTKETIATLTELGCHPEVAHRKNTLLTPDYPHHTRLELERNLGGMGIYVSGALGALVAPVRSNNVSDQEHMWAQVEETGVKLGQYSTVAVREIEHYTSTPDIGYWNWPVFVKNENTLYDIVSIFGMVNRKRYKDDFLKTEVNLWKLGDFRIATIPGEISPDLGLRIKDQSGGDVTMPIGLANDEGGYLMPFADYHHVYFDYERTLSYGQYAAEVIVQKLEALGRLSVYPAPRKLSEIRELLKK